MAPPMSSCCRVKLTLKLSNSSSEQKCWYSIDHEKHETIRSLLKEICKKFQLISLNVALYIDDTIIPTWESCSKIFRDNEIVELREVDVEDDIISFLNLTQQSRKRKQNGDIAITDTCDTLEVKKIKKDRRKKTEGTVTKIKDKRAEGGAHENHTLPGTQLQIDTNSPDKLSSVSSIEGEERDSESDEERRASKIKKSRSIELTPIEKQLVAELESLPKPKKRRKHRKKKSKKASPAKIEQNAVTPDDSIAKKSFQLNCSYQGHKKVFESDGEDCLEVAMETSGHDKTELTNSAVSNAASEMLTNDVIPIPSTALGIQSSTPNINDKSVNCKAKEDCFSVIQVTQLPTASFSSSLTAIPSRNPPTISNAVKPVKMPQTFPQEHRPPTKPTVTRLNTSAKGPVVYKREKLKLRATLSPAILQHLEDSTVKESVDSGGSVCPSNVTNPFTPDRGTAKKNIKWHTKETKTESKSQDLMTKENQQTGVSEESQLDSHEASDVSGSCQVSAEPRDYSLYPNLDGPPRVGDKLAFKRLEVSADYTPVVSEYKEGVVLSYEPKSKMVHIRLDSLPPETKRKGLFEVCIEKEGETLTNVDSQQQEIVDILSNLIEPKLITC